MTRYFSVNNDRAPALFALSMVTLLVACGDGSNPSDAAIESQISAGASVTPELGAATQELGTPPSEIRPSISAAQLLNDNTQTVNFAQSTVGNVAAPEIGAAQPDTSVDLAQIGAVVVPSVPLSTPPATPNPTTQPVTQTAVVAPVVAPAPIAQAVVTPIASTQSPTVTESAAAPQEPVAPVITESAAAPQEPEAPVITESAAAPQEPVAPVITESAAVPQEPVQAAALPADTENTVTRTRFTGSNTPTFVGVLNDDQSVQLDWEVDPTARGYNVYRDAAYIETVFETSYLDEFDAFDQDYYYEIQAFTEDDRFSTIATGLTVNVTGTGRTDPNAPQVDETLLDDYELVFFDEFNGNSVDPTKWNTAYLWGDDLVINNELQHYVDINNEPDFGYNPFTFDGESLIISTVPTPPELLEKANGQEFLSGVITSYDAFKFTYGYIEANVQVPVGKGYWPAFWLLNAYYDQDRPEIDIMEFIGDNQDTAFHTFHWIDSDDVLHSTKSEPTFPIDYSAGFHRFGAEWEPGTVTFYVDGIPRHTITDPKMSQEEMYIIANTAIGGWWPGDPDATTPFPGEYKIDYIRAYQRVGLQLDAPQFENPDSLIPVRNDGSESPPGHLPPPELWPNGFPARDGTPTR